MATDKTRKSTTSRKNSVQAAGASARKADRGHGIPAPTRGLRAGAQAPQTFLSYDLALIGVVTTLIGLGLVMIFSASYPLANLYLGQSTYYLIRQLQWLVVGTIGLVAAAMFDYRKLQNLSVAMMLLTVALLLAVLIIGREHLGATRYLASGRFQPSEIAKLTITIYIAYWLTSKGERLRNVSYGLVPFAVLLGLVAALVVMQPDFDTTIIIVVTALAMFFVAGADIKQLLVSLGVASATLYFAIIRTGYASQRISDFLSNLSNPLSGSDQVRESLNALARGGLAGAGLGESVAKQLGGVPLPWTDSIFVIVGEELGLLGTLTVVALFMALSYIGLRIALRSQDRFGLVLGSGITAWLAFQAFVNMAVSTATLPYSGLTLPFISYGGSSLVACMAAVGVLLSISRYATQQPAQISGKNKPTASESIAELDALRARGRVGRRHWWTRLSNLGRTRRAAETSRGRSNTGSAGSFGVKASSAGRAGTLSRQLVRTKRTIARRANTRNKSSSSDTKRIPRRR